MICVFVVVVVVSISSTSHMMFICFAGIHAHIIYISICLSIMYIFNIYYIIVCCNICFLEYVNLYLYTLISIYIYIYIFVIFISSCDCVYLPASNHPFLMFPFQIKLLQGS